MESFNPIISTRDRAFQEKGIWIFVGIDLAIFLLFFLVFLVEKKADVELFNQSQLMLNETVGFLNTLILITSSWLLVCAIRAITSNPISARNYMWMSMFFGALFVVLKIFEYYQKLSSNITIVENTFFSFYYILTFIHFCHVIAGIIAIKMLSGWVVDSRRNLDDVESTAESVGIYWHMVDFLWVMLFLLLYLLR